MIKFLKFEINGYRSCAETSLELNPELTCLIGINGAGKSNILNALKLLSKISFNRYYHGKSSINNIVQATLIVTASVDEVIYEIKFEIFYDVDEHNYEDVINAEIFFRDSQSNKRKWIPIETRIFEMMSYQMRLGDFPKEPKKSKDENAVISLLAALKKISYYGATQFADPSKASSSLELDDLKISRRYNSFSRSKSHEKFLFDLYIASKSNKKAYKAYLNIIKGIHLVDNITHEVKQIPLSMYKIKSGAVQKTRTKRHIVFPLFQVDSLTLSPNQLSEGTFKTLALVFYILNDKSEMLLIEEPEVCVHHGLLSSIIELIISESKHKQIIISTHSDYVLDKLKPENIVIVTKPQSKGTIATTLSKSLPISDYKALKNYLKETGNLGEYWKLSSFES